MHWREVVGGGAVVHTCTLTFYFFRLVASVQQHVADVGKVEVEKWQEFVGDIWDKRLPHFRDFPGDVGMFVFNPRTGTYGFVDGEEGDDQRQLLDTLDDDTTAQDQDREGPVGNSENSAVNDSDESVPQGICTISVILSHVT